MVATEDQAALKICPIMSARNLTADGMAVPIVNCAGSQCMMWRWWDEKHRGYCGMGPIPTSDYQPKIADPILPAPLPPGVAGPESVPFVQTIKPDSQ